MIPLKVALQVSVILFTFSSCKKDEPVEIKNTIVALQKDDEVLNAKLIRFLIVTLNVGANEITYDRSSNDFVVRNTRLNKAEIEIFYNKSNIYQEAEASK